MRRPSGHRGFTMIEMVVVLAVSAILLAGVSGAIGTLLRVPIKEHAELTAMGDIQQLLFWLTRDGNESLTFTAGTSPDYGTFSGLQLASGATTRMEYRYYYEDHQVMREVVENEAVVISHRVADYIEAYDDVSFVYTPASWQYDEFTHLWSYNQAKVVVTATSTVPALDIPADPPSAAFSATVEVQLRPQSQRDVIVPGSPPEVAALPNQLYFDVSGEPTILEGSYVSGSGADLQRDDTSYYTVRSAGGTNALAWEVTSAPLPYTTITDISIEFIGQVDTAGAYVGLYVYNPDDPVHVDGGYATAPDYEDLYEIKGVDESAFFPLSAEDVSYVDSLPTKVVKIKVRATHSRTFRLSGDMLRFRVAGTLVPGYTIDYEIDTAESPVIVTGTYFSGSGNDLAADDTLYFAVRSDNVLNVPTVTWDAVSEVITTSISSIEVIWVGRVSRQPTYQQFYVYNLTDHGGSGYDSTPDYQATYAATGTDTPLSFSLSPSDVAYISSSVPPQVRLRVKAVRDAGGLSFQLDADQLIFRVQP